MPAHPPVKRPEPLSSWPWDDRGRGEVAADVERIRSESAFAVAMFDAAMRGRLAAWLADRPDSLHAAH